MKIDAYSAPLMVSWQLTRDCNLACLHCCTDSAPGRALPDELTRTEAIAFAGQLVDEKVPYVMLCGGEPTIVPWFYEVAGILADGGVLLKIETNGQNGLDFGRLRNLRSVQISLDGATQETYARMRPGGSLEKALATAKSAVPYLEVTFAPTRLNIHEASRVIDLALSLRAFRFNTGKLMKLGTAAKLWARLEPTIQDYEQFHSLLLRREAELAGKLELCFRPFSLEEELAARKDEPSGTMLVLPNGKVKTFASLDAVCADVRKDTLSAAWRAYRASWKNLPVVV